MGAPPFADRRAAGRELAGLLSPYSGRDDLAVLALPRGGVPVAYEVAEALGAPLDVLVVRKLGVPGQEELAMGAIASGVRVLNPEIIDTAGVTADEIDAVTAYEQAELGRRDQLYRGDRAPIEVRDRTVILVDDGLATGATMRAAIVALRHRASRAIVAAVPVAAERTCAALRPHADRVVCARTPRRFVAVGSWYDDFAAIEDDEVRTLLEDAAASRAERRA